MSQSTLVLSGKKSYFISAAMSLGGMLAAIPVALTLFSPNMQANATPNNNGADSAYSQYAYAYTQGYLANANTTNTNMGTDPNQCGGGAVMPSGGMGSFEGAGAWAGPSTAVAASANTSVPVHHMDQPGRGNIGGNDNKQPLTPAEMDKVIRNSYNTYTYIRNSTYTNSNNTIGSNNTTSTSVSVRGSRNVDISTQNDSTLTNDVKNVAVSDSFNRDSHDTTTNTTNTSTAVNDSFNRDSNNPVSVVKDSGNTTTTVDNTTVNKTEDSGNTTTINKTQDSNNDTAVNSGNKVVIADNGNQTTDNSHQDNSVENTTKTTTVNKTDTTSTLGL